MRFAILCSSLSALLLASFAHAADSPAQAKRPARKPNPALAKIDDVPGLPRVLLIGDSISIGYTLDVRAGLAGKANVHRIPTNGGPTTNGVKNIDSWLGDSKWDVIHFNWGLHDLKYIDAQGALAKHAADGTQQVSLADYERNLDQLVQRMRQTGAKLIFATTTPVPEGAAGRVPGDAARYNEAALQVMKKHSVAIDDLYAFSQPQLQEIQLPANVHFSPAGSKKLSEAVVKSIEAELPKR